MGKYLDSIGLSHFMGLIKQALAGKSDTGHTHAAGDITSGTLAIGRIPTGSTSSTVALGNHSHSQYFDNTTSRTANTVLAAPNGSAGAASFRKLVVADLPTGTTASTVALGNHTHAASAITSGTLDVARLSSARTHRTSHGNIDAVTTAPTAAAVGSWNYDKYSDGLVHAWGIIRTQNQGITTSLGTGFYWNSTAMYVALPVKAKFIMSVQYGYSMGGSQGAGAYLMSTGSTSDWSTGGMFYLKFNMARPVSGSSGTYWFPVDVWYMAA